MRVLITGGCGRCGTALVSLQYEKVFFDRQACVPSLAAEHFVQGDLNDDEKLAEAMIGCDAIVHLAADSRTDATWEEVLKDNIVGTQNVLKAAVAAGLERVIFASTNHVVGMYELDNAPGIYELGHGFIVDRDAEVRPDSYYGVSKALGEDLGRFHADNGGPKFYSLRIGSVADENDDHPYALAERGVQAGTWKPGSAQYELNVNRMKAIWQSRRDFVQMVALCLEYKGPSFDIFYGVSNNPRRWLDIEHAKQALGYLPQDNGEEWTQPPVSK